MDGFNNRSNVYTNSFFGNFHHKAYFDYVYGKKFRNKFKYPTYSFSKPNDVAIKPPLLGSISNRLPEKETETKFETCNHHQKTSSSSTIIIENKNGSSTKSSCSRQNIQKMFLELNKSDHKQTTISSSSSSIKKKNKEHHTLLKMLLQNAEYPWKKIKDKLTCSYSSNGISYNNCSNTSNKNAKKSRTPFTSHNVRKIEKEDVTSLPMEANVGHLSNNTLQCNCDYHQNVNILEETSYCRRHHGLKRSLFHKPSQTFICNKKEKIKHGDLAIRRSNSYPNNHLESKVDVSKPKSACNTGSEFLLHKSYRNYLVNPVFVHCSNPNYFFNTNKEIMLHRTVSSHDLKAFEQSQEQKTTTTTVNININLENKNVQKDLICCSEKDFYCNILVDPSTPLVLKQKGYRCQDKVPSEKPGNATHTTNNKGVKNVDTASTQRPERVNKMVQKDLNVKKDVGVQNPYRENKNIQTEKPAQILRGKNQLQQVNKSDKNIYLVAVNNHLEADSTSSSVRSISDDNATLSSSSKCSYQNYSKQPKLVPYSVSSSEDTNGILQSQNKDKYIDIFYNFGNNYNVFQCEPQMVCSNNQYQENSATIFLNGIEEAPWICIFDGISNFKSGSDTSFGNKDDLYNSGGVSSKTKNNAHQQQNDNSNIIQKVVSVPKLKHLDTQKCCIPHKNNSAIIKKEEEAISYCETKNGTTTRRSGSICNIMDYINPLNKSVQFSSDYITKDNLRIGYIISRIEDLLNVLNDNIAEKINKVNWTSPRSYQTFQNDDNGNNVKPNKSLVSIQDQTPPSASSWEKTDFNSNCNNEHDLKPENVKQPTSCNNTVVTLSLDQNNITQEDTWKTKWLKRLCKNCESNKYLTYPRPNTISETETNLTIRKSARNKQHINKGKDIWDPKYNSNTKIFYCKHWNEKNNFTKSLKSSRGAKSSNSDHGTPKIILKKCLKCRKYIYAHNKSQQQPPPKTARYHSHGRNVGKKVSRTSVTSSTFMESSLDKTLSQEVILSLMDPKREKGDNGDHLEDDHHQDGVDLREDTFLKMMEPKRNPVIIRDLSRGEKKPKQVTVSKMNGMNGHTNGDLNGCDIITQNQQKGCWTIGLINSKFKYLTAETFGFKINANGASLKKKQIWTLEPDLSTSGESYIYLKSHLDKYLAVDSFGNVTCENEEKDPGSKFLISVAEDGTGRWAFRNVVRGYCLGASQDKLTCTAKIPGDAEFWLVHLAARPQVNLRSVGRKRFAHLSENQEEIYVDANIPWGEDTLFTLEFRADESGKYALHTCNNKYLSLGGKLVDKCSSDCLFTAEYHSGYLALRDKNGSYLSPIGSKAVLKTRSNTVTKDELFSLEDSLPQASFVAALNAKYVSVKQGVDVTANQDEISDHETFQLEFDWSTKRWYIRTMQDRYWTLETGGGIQAAGDKRSSNALFDLIWQGDGSVAFRANNGRYVTTKRSGHLYANSDTVDENSKYFFYLINRPILVLKSEQGFVGYRSGNNTKLECNKAMYETIQVERAEKGIVYFKGQNGKYWQCDSEGVTADSDVPEGFYLELREPTRLSIKSVNGSYLTASKNGVFRLGDSSYENATQWEY